MCCEAGLEGCRRSSCSTLWRLRLKAQLPSLARPRADATPRRSGEASAPERGATYENIEKHCCSHQLTSQLIRSIQQACGHQGQAAAKCSTASAWLLLSMQPTMPSGYAQTRVNRQACCVCLHACGSHIQASILHLVQHRAGLAKAGSMRGSGDAEDRRLGYKPRPAGLRTCTGVRLTLLRRQPPGPAA